LQLVETSVFLIEEKYYISLLMKNDVKNELYNIVSGKSKVRFGTVIQAITSYLSHGSQPSPTSEIKKSLKKQETTILENYITQNPPSRIYLAFQADRFARLLFHFSLTFPLARIYYLQPA